METHVITNQNNERIVLRAHGGRRVQLLGGGEAARFGQSGSRRPALDLGPWRGLARLDALRPEGGSRVVPPAGNALPVGLEGAPTTLSNRNSLE